jgi:hypothetical protein
MKRSLIVMLLGLGWLWTGSQTAYAVCDTPGWQTCESWCKENRGNSESCLYTHPRSCMKRYGSLKTCVRSGPPGGATGARKASAGETCSFQNAKCMDFCEHTSAGRSQGASCTDACRSRQRVCLKSGIYEWRNSPNVTGLIKR